MKATNCPLTNIVNGIKQFIIPVFQRDYSWTTDQCQQMWDDILRVSSGGEGHFFGSIVYVQASLPGAVFSDWLVVDGQQRLTSLTLLLTALRDRIADSGWSGAGDGPTVEQINAFFLKNDHEKGDRKYKLALRRADDATLRSLVDSKNPPDNHSESIIDAYEFFSERLRDPACDLDAVYRGVHGLNVVDVTLDRNVDNPQLVFESMNSTGVDLAQSDLVRNYLLMGLGTEEQGAFYEKYWRGIEDFFRASSESFESFLRDYMALRKGYTQSMRLDRVYREFKAIWPSGDGTSLESLLSDMARVARFYASFRGLTPARSETLAGAMENVRKLATTPGLLVMRLCENHEKGLISEKELIDAVSLIESYILRRTVVGLSARNYYATFATITRDKELNFESFRVALALLRDNNRFPGDEEFQRALEDHDLYALRNCKHILDRLENGGQLEPSPVRDYSIEHIMPQDIADVKEWKEMLGGDWQEIHDKWVHRLGNLTLTAYNSKYSNRSFKKKREMEGGFKQSAVRLNEYVRNQDEWTHVQMSKRGRKLAKRALKIWPSHEADPARIREAHTRQLHELAAGRRPDSLKMSDNVRALLDAIRRAVGELGEIIETVENKSVCCHGPGFFAELLPMAYYVRVILPLDFDEMENPDGLNVHDASGWKFVPNRVHTDCNLLVDIHRRDEIAKATPMIRQAFDRQGL